jgi:hypothetical protein
MRRASFIVLAAIAAIACRNDRGSPPGPSLLIQDALHNGNAFFYWLDPVMQQQIPLGQVFSSKITPSVTVTNLCTGAVIRTFAGADVQATDGSYHVNWHTPDDNLDPACNYRLTVAVGATALGVADVDVVDSGKEFKNVNTDEFIPLLDDRTLPVKFFVGVGSLCDPGVSDCGEAVAQPGVNTTVVTTSGRAGVFIPGDALTEAVTVTIQSVDNPPDGGCIPGLPQQYAGTPKIDNSCYDFHATPLTQTAPTGHYTFDDKVTVGICPPVTALQGSHALLDLLQIFQFDDLGNGQTMTLPLNNVPAPFLTCDPMFNPTFGMRRSMWGELARGLAKVFGPEELHASTRTAMFDMGAGGSTDGFSRFTWALPTMGRINFDVAPDLTPIAPGAVINTAYSHIGVTFSRTSGVLGAMCQGTSVYANSGNGSNTISLCPLGTPPAFSAQAGEIVAQFTVPVAEVCLDVAPIVSQLQANVALPGAFLQALDTTGNVLASSTATLTPQTQHVCVDGSAIAAVQFAGAGAALAVFDNLSFSRVPVSQ